MMANVADSNVKRHVANLPLLIRNYNSKYGYDPMRLPYSENADCDTILQSLCVIFQMEFNQENVNCMMRKRYYDNVCQKCYSYVPETGYKCDWCLFARKFQFFYHAEHLVRLTGVKQLFAMRDTDYLRCKFLSKCLREKVNCVLQFFNLDPYQTNNLYLALKTREICATCKTHVPSIGPKCERCHETLHIPINQDVFEYVYNLTQDEDRIFKFDYVNHLLCEYTVKDRYSYVHVENPFNIVTLRSDKNICFDLYDVDQAGYILYKYINDSLDVRNEILATIKFDNPSRLECEKLFCKLYDYPYDRYIDLKSGQIDSDKITENDDNLLLHVRLLLINTNNYNYMTMKLKKRCRECKYSFYKCDVCLHELPLNDYTRKLSKIIAKKTKTCKRLRKLSLSI